MTKEKIFGVIFGVVVVLIVAMSTTFYNYEDTIAKKDIITACYKEQRSHCEGIWTR